MIDEEPQLDRDAAGVNQVVEDSRKFPSIGHTESVLNHHQAGRFGSVVLSGYVNPVLADCAGVDFAAEFEGAGDFSAGHTGLFNGFRRRGP